MARLRALRLASKTSHYVFVCLSVLPNAGSFAAHETVGPEERVYDVYEDGVACQLSLSTKY